MWGNLRQSIANASESGLIAKLGDVVAPKSNDEDDDEEYEYETGSDENDDDEYYEEEQIDGGVHYEEEEIDYSEVEDLNQGQGVAAASSAYAAKALTAGNDSEHQVDRLREGRAAMGKLFGGVLQKGREKLNETARQFVDQDQYGEEEEAEEAEVEEEEEEFLNNQVKKDSYYEEYTSSTSSFSREEEGIQTSMSMEHGTGQEIMSEVALSYDNEKNDNNNNTDDSLIVGALSSSKNILSCEVKDNITESNIGALEEASPTAATLNAGGADADDDDDYDTDNVNVKGEAYIQNVYAESNNTDDEIEYHSKELTIESMNSTADNDISEKNNSEPQTTIPVDTNVEQSSLSPQHERKKVSFAVELKEETQITSQLVGNHNVTTTTNISGESEEENDISDLSSNNYKFGKPLQLSSSQLMENGNDPSAIECLDETVGHSFNLQETGLDATHGHILEIDEDEHLEVGLDRTHGHQLDIDNVYLDQTKGHELDIDNVYLDQTKGHELDIDNVYLDQTKGHYLEINNSFLDQTNGHPLELSAHRQQHNIHVHDVVVDDSGLDQTHEHLSDINDNEQREVGLDKTYGHRKDIKNVGLDQTKGHYLEINNSFLDQTNGHPLELSAHRQQHNINVQATVAYESKQQIDAYKSQVARLESELEQAKATVSSLERIISQTNEEHKETIQKLKKEYEEDKEFLVNTADETHAEEVESAVQKVKDDMEKYILQVQNEMAIQMEQSDQQLEQFRIMYEEAKSRADKIEVAAKKEATKHTHQLAEIEKKNAIALERVEQKASRAIAVLDDKDTQIYELNNIIKDMKKTIQQNVAENEAVEDEADELHQENEVLREKIEAMEAERQQLKNDLQNLQEEHGKSLGVQIELQLLREERDREKEKVEALKDTQSSNESTLIAERDSAKAAVLDLEQRYAALQADLDLVKSDFERSLLANSNLQNALEAFQVERESEIAMLEESRLSSEEAIKASNDLALQSMKQENEAAMREVQLASNKAIQNMMSEMSVTEQKLEEYRKETINLRRSLDEAIHRLQTNQEDVIDRSLMKNILLDWHSKSGKARREVMLVMSSVLHFTDDDKDKCGIGEGSSTINRVVGAVAPPLNPAVKMPQELHGDTLREKWVNFLLAECDSPKNEKQNPPSAPKVTSRQNRTTQSLEL